MSLVLVADDEPAVLEVLTEVVEDLGHQVVRAHDGREALHIAKQQHPQLVVTDHMMPRLSGVELCRAMRSDDDLRYVPVILLSAALPPEANEASAFLAKPFELDEFESLVTRTLLGGEATPAERAAPIPAGTPSDLVHWVAFELKTPLAAARAHLQMLDRKVSASGPAAEGRHLDMVARQLEDLEQVIEKISDAARLAQGQLTLELQRVDLAEAAGVEVAAWREREPGYQFELEAGAEVAVRGDRRRLGQILGILIANAVRHGTPPRHVRVEVQTVGGAGELRVRDFGGGLSKAAAEKLERLRAVSGPAPLSAAGPGFGLFIASELIRLHGGTLHAHSEPGTGTIFTASLPRAD
ncbi:MAG TPA: response regulator [Myxococcaceae bacterium]|nr:response regulator [Myxococcaceae bacterium]